MSEYQPHAITEIAPKDFGVVNDVVTGKVISAREVIDAAYEFLKSSSELTGITRTQGPANRLGLQGLDTTLLPEDTKQIVKDAKRIEIERGAAGMNPEAVKFVWKSGNLCLNSLARVIDNDRAWRTQKYTSRPNGW